MRGLAIAWVLATAAIAHADPDSSATRLFEEGRIAAKAGNYSEACAKFTRSLELDPAAGTELNLADCFEHQGATSRAWKLYDDVANKSEHDNPARAKLARERADALQPKLATIVLEVAEPQAAGLAITIGGKPVTPGAEIRERIEPGQLDIAATLPGKPRFTRTVQAAAGVTVTIDIPSFDAVRVIARPIETAEPHRRRSRVYLAAGIGLVGVVSLLVAGQRGLSARSDYHDALGSLECMDPRLIMACNAKIDDAGHEADEATVFLITGAVLAVTGATLYFTAPREHAIAVTPMASTTGIGLVLNGQF